MKKSFDTIPGDPIDGYRLIETHISWVYIGEVWTFKIKKPVKLDFLDFSNPDLVKSACDEEVLRNSEISHQLEYQTANIELSNSQIVESKSGTYCVKLRSFNSTLLDLVESGHSHFDQLDTLVDLVSKFHHNNETLTSTNISPWSEEHILGMFEENIEIMQREGGINHQQKDIYLLTQYVQSKLPKLTSQSASRRKKVMRCHGDLHFGNICLYENKLIPFDCIEFNDEFSLIDPLYDFAFLLSDIMIHCQDYAFRAIDRYIETTQDYQGLSLLKTYVIMRLIIRGNISSFQANDEARLGEERKSHSKTAQVYYGKASELIQQKKGTLLATIGFSGSGKSYISKQLSSHLPIIRLSSDGVRKSLQQIKDFTTTKGDYSPAWNDRVYDALNGLGIDMCEQGWNIILDATFIDISRREQLISQSSSSDITPSFIYLDTDTETNQERIQNRKNDISDADTDILLQQIQQHKRPLESHCDLKIKEQSFSQIKSLVEDLIDRDN